MLLINFSVNKYYKLIWFRHIFLNFRYLLFFNNCLKLTINNSRLCLNLSNYGLNFTVLSKVESLFNYNKYFNFLSTNIFLVYLNTLNNINYLFSLNLILLGFSYNGYFVNVNYLFNIFVYISLFYKNYWQLIRYIEFYTYIYFRFLYFIKILLLWKLKCLRLLKV